MHPAELGSTVREYLGHYGRGTTQPPDNPNVIRPGVLLPDGTTYYPTGLEYLLAFALAGCGWAIEALAAWEAAEPERWAGDCI